MAHVPKGRWGAKYPQKTSISFARFLRSRATDCEWILWNQLRRRRLGFYFRRQRPVGKYILDFYCEERHVGIEVDGSIHLKQQAYDIQRDEKLFLRGVRMMRFSNERILHDLPGVIDEIRIALQCSPPPERGRG
jgi:very-short-patch-repair endonuclease